MGELIMTYDDIVAYASKIGIAFTRGDVEDIMQRADEDRHTDHRLAVWDYLDEYEGISHTRDLELFPNGDDD
jgi:hypothetical protein